MSLKRIHVETNGDRTVKVYRDSEWNEYRARLYESGKLYAPADYHTDDRTDAIETAKKMAEPPMTLKKPPLEKTAKPHPLSRLLARTFGLRAK